MDFETIIKEATPSTNRDLVGLVVYYHDQIEETSSITSQDIYDTIDKSRLKEISPQSIGAHIRYLKRENLISKNGNGYRLTLQGLGYYEEKIGTVKSRGEDIAFLSISHIDDEFYKDLVDNINESYREGIDDAVLVLTRKLLENLLIDILRTRYGLTANRIDLFYNTNKRQFRRFSKLIENLESSLEDLEYFSDRLDEDIVTLLKELKAQGDASAHSIEVNPSEEEMAEYQVKAGKASSILFYTLAKIRESK
ncbi:hypothetical protein ACFQO4_13885 [Saliphagus sp. GCM10025334]